MHLASIYVPPHPSEHPTTPGNIPIIMEPNTRTMAQGFVAWVSVSAVANRLGYASTAHLMRLFPKDDPIPVKMSAVKGKRKANMSKFIHVMDMSKLLTIVKARHTPYPMPPMTHWDESERPLYLDEEFPSREENRHAVATHLILTISERLAKEHYIHVSDLALQLESVRQLQAQNETLREQVFWLNELRNAKNYEAGRFKDLFEALTKGEVEIRVQNRIEKDLGYAELQFLQSTLPTLQSTVAGLESLPAANHTRESRTALQQAQNALAEATYRIDDLRSRYTLTKTMTKKEQELLSFLQ